MKHYKSIIIMSAFVFLISTPALADSTSTMKVKASSTRMQIRQKINTNTQRACSKLEDRIDKRLSTFDTRFQDQLSVYKNHSDKLHTISSKLQVSGQDVSKLNVDIATLDQKISTFTTHKDAVEAALTQAKGFSCNTSNGEFKSSVETLQDAQKLVMSDVKDLYGFVRTTLKGDISTLKTSYQHDK